MEIGSEFWIERYPVKYKYDIPIWIRKFGNVVMTASGRGAISLLIDEVKVQHKTVLLPSYICDSVIIPFRDKGFSCYFYDINENLIPDIGEAIIDKEIGIFIHIGYFGFSTNSGLQRIIQKLKARSTIIVEDITHSIFSEYQRYEENDYYVASLRKWAGLPSGGFLASIKRNINTISEYNDSFTEVRKKALQIKSEYIANKDTLLKQQYLNLFSEGEKILDEDNSAYCVDNFSLNLINELDTDDIIKKRRANFIALSESVMDLDNITPIFTKPDRNICPMFYPVYVNKNRSDLKQYLIEHEIYCPVHWPVPEQINKKDFTKASAIYDRILSIPCDQRYSVDDMNRIVTLLKKL